MTEAYDSDSDSGSSTGSVSPATIKKEAVVNDTFDDDAEEVEEVLDWESVMSRLRISILDRSKKRRAAFIGRYLNVTQTCE